MIGIYKITSPSNKIYIGQSVDVERRIRTHKHLHCKNSILLYNSLKKHGVNLHKFEIVTECSIDKLNEKERHYQDLYLSTGVNGLNLKLTNTNDKSGHLSDETRKKIGRSNFGKSHTEETLKKLKEIKFGTKPSEKCVQARVASIKGKKQKKEHVNSRVQSRKDAGTYDWKEERKQAFSALQKTKPIWNKGKKCPGISKSKRGGKNPSARKVKDTETGRVFETITDASIHYGIKITTLQQYLSGARKNKTKATYL